MTFDELQQLAEKDLKIDNLQLDIESLKTPQLHNKWMKFHNQYTNLLKKAEQDLARLTREKWEYSQGRGKRFKRAEERRDAADAEFDKD